MFADRIALMADGAFVACGAAAEVLQPRIIEQAYGLAVRIIAHPTTGRPIVVPEAVQKVPGRSPEPAHERSIG